jgi:UDP-N-acetylmuramyl tripeptide synthase
MNPTKNSKATFKNDSKWRRLKVLYIVCSILLIGISFAVVQVSDSQVSCETTPSNFTATSTSSDWWDRGSSECSTASQSGDGIGLGAVLGLIVVLGVGYLFLPKLHAYLHPTKANREQADINDK